MFRVAFSALGAVFLAAASAEAQRWEPTDASDPWGASGTKVCSDTRRNDDNYFCLAVFCTAPGEPMICGYENVSAGGEGEQDVVASVDRRQSWPMTLTLLPGRGHAVGVVPLDPGRLPGFYQSLRAGSRLYFDTLDGWEHMIVLTGSNAELARLEGVCAPPRPLELGEIEITRIGRLPEGAPAPEVETAVPDEAVAAPAPEPSTPAEPAVRRAAPAVAIPGVPAPVVGAADWEPVPDGDGEGLIATRICFPEMRGGARTQCLNVGCYEGWRDASLLFEDRAFPASDWRGDRAFPITLSTGEAAARLPFSVNPDARTLIAAGLASDTDWAAASAILSRDGPLRIDLPLGAVTVMAGNATAEFARIGAACTFPAAAPVATPAAPAVPEGVDAPAAPEAPDGPRRIDFAALEPAMDPSGVGLDPVFFEIHGAVINGYRGAFGEMPAEMGFARVEAPAGPLVFSQLCGGGGWFGADGCMGYVHHRTGGAWREIFSDGELPYGLSVSVDGGSVHGGWPDLVIEGPRDGVRWRFRDGAYGVLR